MAAKRYKLTPEIKASMWMKDNTFRFRVSYQKGDTYVDRRKCPEISMGDTAVIQTTNEWAQRSLGRLMIPKGWNVNNVPQPTGSVFVDVTATVPVADIDLDSLFP